MIPLKMIKFYIIILSMFALNSASVEKKEQKIGQNKIGNIDYVKNWLINAFAKQTNDGKVEKRRKGITSLLPSQIAKFLRELHEFVDYKIVEKIGAEKYKCQEGVEEMGVIGEEMLNFEEMIITGVGAMISLGIRVEMIVDGKMGKEYDLESGENGQGLLRKLIKAMECIPNTGYFDFYIEPIINLEAQSENSEKKKEKVIGLIIDCGQKMLGNESDFMVLQELSRLHLSPREIFEGTKRLENKSDDSSLPFLAQKLHKIWGKSFPIQIYNLNKKQFVNYPMEECQMDKFKGEILKNLLEEGKSRKYFEGTIMEGMEEKIRKELIWSEEVTNDESNICHQWRSDMFLKEKWARIDGFAQLHNLLRINWNPWKDLWPEIEKLLNEFKNFAESECNLDKKKMLTKFEQFSGKIPPKMAQKIGIDELAEELRKEVKAILRKMRQNYNQKYLDNQFKYLLMIKNPGPLRSIYRKVVPKSADGTQNQNKSLEKAGVCDEMEQWKGSLAQTDKVLNEFSLKKAEKYLNKIKLDEEMKERIKEAQRKLMGQIKEIGQMWKKKSSFIYP